MENKMFALVLYIDPTNSSGDVIDEIVAVSTDKLKLYSLKLEKEQDSNFIEVQNDINENNESCWHNTDVTNIYYSVTEVNVV